MFGFLKKVATRQSTARTFKFTSGSITLDFDEVEIKIKIIKIDSKFFRFNMIGTMSVPDMWKGEQFYKNLKTINPMTSGWYKVFSQMFPKLHHIETEINRLDGIDEMAKFISAFDLICKETIHQSGILKSKFTGDKMDQSPPPNWEPELKLTEAEYQAVLKDLFKR